MIGRLLRRHRRITVSELRRKYPDPVVGPPSGPGMYCVGGALARELGVNGIGLGWFPPALSGGSKRRPCLVMLLKRANPRLDWTDALVIADHVIQENDAGNFDDAWAWLDKGLSE